MCRLLTFSFCVLLHSITAYAQDETSNEIMGQINRIVSSLRVARVEAANESSELEIVPEQAKQIATLAVEYRSMLEEFNAFVEDDNQTGALSFMASNLPGFNTKLHSDILLPHQSQHLTTQTEHKRNRD